MSWGSFTLGRCSINSVWGFKRLIKFHQPYMYLMLSLSWQFIIRHWTLNKTSMHSSRMRTARFGGYCEQNDWQTGVKTLPFPKLFAGGNKVKCGSLVFKFTMFEHCYSMHSLDTCLQHSSWKVIICNLQKKNFSQLIRLPTKRHQLWECLFFWSCSCVTNPENFTENKAFWFSLVPLRLSLDRTWRNELWSVEISSFSDGYRSM